MRQVRKLRHWKQQFDKGAAFIWRRPTRYGGRMFACGTRIPKELKDSPTKLRRFWESERIELAQFEDPNVLTGQTEKKSRASKKKPIVDKADKADSTTTWEP